MNNKQYVVDTIYCNDRQLQSGTGVGTTTTFYKIYERLYNNKTPTLKCIQVNDRFTKNTTLNGIEGNGKLENPIGLITADEVAYAGGVYDTNNTKYYLYTGSYFWTISPAGFGGYYVYEFDVDNTGGSNGRILSLKYGVRPVISLSFGSLTSGTGTMNNPFKISS